MCFVGALNEHTYWHIHPNLICTLVIIFSLCNIEPQKCGRNYAFSDSHWLTEWENNTAAYMSYLFRFVSQTTSRSAWASPSARAARRAPWCTSSSGSPHAGSSPPQPYQCDSPGVHKHKAPLNHHKVTGHQSLVQTFPPQNGENKNIHVIPPGESLPTSQSDWTLWSLTGWGCPGSSGASGWSPWTGCHPHTEGSEPERTEQNYNVTVKFFCTLFKLQFTSMTIHGLNMNSYKL